MNSRYHVWRVGGIAPIFLGCVEGEDYMLARHRAEHDFGGQIEVYLPPNRSITNLKSQPIKDEKCEIQTSMIVYESPMMFLN